MFNFDRTNLTPTNNWEKEGDIAKNKNTGERFRSFNELNDRLIFVGLATIGTVFQTIQSLVFMSSSVVNCVKNLFTWNKEELKEKPSHLLKITISALMRIVILAVCSIIGIFSPNNAKQIYKEIEINTYYMKNLYTIFNAPDVIKVDLPERVPIAN